MTLTHRHVRSDQGNPHGGTPLTLDGLVVLVSGTRAFLRFPIPFDHVEEVEDAAYRFVARERREGTSELIESVVLTEEKAQALDAEFVPGSIPAWWMGFEVPGGQARVGDRVRVTLRDE